jgi:hypothetical protein
VEANEKYIKARSKQWDMDKLPQFGSIVRAPRRSNNSTNATTTTNLEQPLVWFATFSLKRLRYASTDTGYLDRYMKSPSALWYCNDKEGTLVGNLTRGDVLVVECAIDDDGAPLTEIRIHNITYHVGAHVQCELESPLVVPVGNVTGGLFLFGAMAKNVQWMLPWIEYHRMIGVDHFYLYLMDSYTKEEQLLLPNLPYITYVPFLCHESSRNGATNVWWFQNIWVPITSNARFVVPIQSGRLSVVILQ